MRRVRHYAYFFFIVRRVESTSLANFYVYEYMYEYMYVIRRKRCVRCNMIVIVCFKANERNATELGEYLVWFYYSLVSSNKYVNQTWGMSLRDRVKFQTDATTIERYSMILLSVPFLPTYAQQYLFNIFISWQILAVQRTYVSFPFYVRLQAILRIPSMIIFNYLTPY